MPYCAHNFIATPTIPVCILCGRTPHASPSQVEQWMGCRRKHAYNRTRPRRSQGQAAAYGERCHKIIEDWLRDGTPPDANTPEGRTVLPVLSLLPMPRTPGMLLEQRATPNLLGVNWDMRIDLVYGYVPGAVVCADDHKSTGDISENAKTVETLTAKDPQGIAYSHWAAETFNVPWVVGTWRYMQRDARAKPRPVTFTISRQDACDRFAEMHVTYVLPMVRSRTEPPEAFPRDGIDNGFCFRFGQCEHLHECHAGLTSEESARVALIALRRIEPRKELAAA